MRNDSGQVTSAGKLHPQVTSAIEAFRASAPVIQATEARLVNTLTLPLTVLLKLSTSLPPTASTS